MYVQRFGRKVRGADDVGDRWPGLAPERDEGRKNFTLTDDPERWRRAIFVAEHLADMIELLTEPSASHPLVSSDALRATELVLEVVSGADSESGAVGLLDWASSTQGAADSG